MFCCLLICKPKGSPLGLVEYQHLVKFINVQYQLGKSEFV